MHSITRNSTCTYKCNSSKSMQLLYDLSHELEIVSMVQWYMYVRMYVSFSEQQIYDIVNYTWNLMRGGSWKADIPEAIYVGYLCCKFLCLYSRYVWGHFPLIPSNPPIELHIIFLWGKCGPTHQVHVSALTEG